MSLPAFNRTVTELGKGNIIIPMVQAALLDPDFAGFPLEVEPWRKRKPDGWFHPSTHATWTARQLALYLLHPNAVAGEEFTITSILAITQGKLWHLFIQKLLLDAGVLLPRPGVSKTASITEQVEVPLRDPAHMRTGHSDGEVDDGGFEFKTMNRYQIPKINNPADLLELKPAYYAQTQDYLDMAGWGQMRYLIMALEHPFPMTELVVPADSAFQAAQRAKYAQAMQAAADRRLPSPCCAPRSAQARGCPMRRVCEIGQVQ